MTDNECRELLRLLHKFCTEYTPDIPPAVVDLASDLAMGMEVTTDKDDQMYREIENAYR